MMKNLQKENEILKKRIDFLELVIDTQNEIIDKSNETTRLLLDYVRNYYPKNDSTSS